MLEESERAETLSFYLLCSMVIFVLLYVLLAVQNSSSKFPSENVNSIH